MSDLIRREDAARIAEDHNLDIWEYSTGNRSRIGHDPVAEAIRALPTVQPGHVNKTPKSEHDARDVLTPITKGGPA